MPPSLVAALLKEFPAYRVAAVSDYPDADIERHKLNSNLAVRWRISVLGDLGNEQPLRTGVDPLPAGSYANAHLTEETSSGQAQALQVKRYLASNPGFVAGTTEAPGNAFFFTGKRWIHLRLPD